MQQCPSHLSSIQLSEELYAVNDYFNRGSKKKNDYFNQKTEASTISQITNNFQGPCKLSVRQTVI